MSQRRIIVQRMRQQKRCTTEDNTILKKARITGTVMALPSWGTEDEEEESVEKQPSEVREKIHV